MTADTISAALCAAIDNGDDSALPILADLLEEQGDSMAEGLRDIAATYRPTGLPTFERNRPGYGWKRGRATGSYWVAEEIFDRLVVSPFPFGRDNGGGWGATVTYPSRSAAYLALAAALIGR